MVSAISRPDPRVSPELWQRALTIIIDGLASTPPNPHAPAGKPLDRDQRRRAISKHGHP